MILKFRKIRSFLLLVVIVLSVPTTVVAEATTLYRSVERALNTNPQLQALSHNRQALQQDLKQSRGRYLPTVDLLLGYGLEQFSDDVTRKAGAQPSDSDWDSREDASLRLTQKVYDGGETSSQVSIRKALLDSGDHQLRATAQALALDAIIAHLNVFQQRELVPLAENNLKIHREIHQSLAERERAGAGSIAEVTQAQARMARSESTLYLSQADLSRAIANYTRVVGVPPAELAYAGVPETLPQTPEESLQQIEERNPELLAADAEIVEADSRLGLARSNYKPKIDLELSSRYNDQLEASQSWQNTNAAMLNLRWNLYHGGQDKAGATAALSRKNQSRSRRAAKLIELTEANSAIWADYLSLDRQKPASLDAADYSRQTFDAYLKQFTVSKRSLQDVLIAENDYFQSAVQLIAVDINETIAAYRILALTGSLQVPRCSGMCGYPEELSRLSQSLFLPSPEQTASLDFQVEPLSIHQGPVQALTFSKNKSEAVDNDDASPEIMPSPFFTIEIGPCINRHELDQAAKALRDHGFNVRQVSGSGPVKMIRLFEGVYPVNEARRRLAVLKKAVGSAFVMSQEGQLGLYAASFRKPGQASRFAELLEQQKISVVPIATDVEMQGTFVVAQQANQEISEMIADQMERLGLKTRLVGNDADEEEGLLGAIQNNEPVERNLSVLQ